MHTLTRGAPAELYQSLVREGARRGGCPLDEASESYLVFVLLRHQRDDLLLVRTQALEWLQAQERCGRARADALRDVGDRCLLIAGLYPALAERRRVSLDYFIDLGRGAYRDVAAASRDAYGELFAQLAAGYRELVRVLHAVRAEVEAPPVAH